jgi:BirA family biotin operon repressor/biotin-[acetyl-CoA-carboxylase] ligase
MPTPYSVKRLGVATSTQDVARESFRGTPMLVVADRQEHGRGRTGSAWENADRAVALSLAFEPSWSRADWVLIPLAAGVAASRATGAALKWPNDLLVDESKVGGILVEASSEGPVVVGFGLNLWWQEPPVGMAGLFDHDPGESAAGEVAAAIARSLLSIIAIPSERWPRDEYVARCVTLGREITWEPGGAGTAVGIADDGGLVVETESGREVIRSGAVRHVRPRGR